MKNDELLKRANRYIRSEDVLMESEIDDLIKELRDALCEAMKALHPRAQENNDD